MKGSRFDCICWHPVYVGSNQPNIGKDDKAQSYLGSEGQFKQLITLLSFILLSGFILWRFQNDQRSQGQQKEDSNCSKGQLLSVENDNWANQSSYSDKDVRNLKPIFFVIMEEQLENAQSAKNIFYALRQSNDHHRNGKIPKAQVERTYNEGRCTCCQGNRKELMICKILSDDLGKCSPNQISH